MKRLFIILTGLVLCIGTTSAQEAFKHLALGIEGGTTGAGVELSLPIVTNHIVLKAGYNFPNVQVYSGTNNVNVRSISDDINRYIDEANAQLAKIGRQQMSYFPEETDIAAQGKVNFGAMKAMLEFYPSKRSGFHFTAGVFVGQQDLFVDATANIGQMWKTYQENLAIFNSSKQELAEAGLSVDDFPEFRASYSGKSYKISDGNVNLGFKLPKIRPYLGIGFGRSIPKSRLGFQFDLGVWYHGTPEISSTNEVPFSVEDQVIEIDDFDISQFCLYPAISFRLTYRLF